MNTDKWLLEQYENLKIDGSWLEVAADLSFLCSYPVIGVLMAFAILYLYSQKEYQKAMVVVAFVMASAFLYEGMRNLLGWPRQVNEPLVLAGTVPRALTGHSMLTMCVYTVLAQALNLGQKRLLIIYAVVLSMLIGVCRALIGVHYTSDVIIGWGIGGGLGYLYSYANEWIETIHKHSRRADDILPFVSFAQHGSNDIPTTGDETTGVAMTRH